MKKLFSLLAALALVLTLAACNQDPQEIIKEVIKEVEVEVPGETVYVEVPGEEVIVEVEVPGPTVEVEVIVEVPTDVENTRFYKPGVYFNNTEIGTDGFYTYTVVIVDAYGKIAGVMFDETKTTSEFLVDEDGQLYVFIEGDGKTVPHTYRAIDSDADFSEYPTAADAITADDLVVGIHQTEIAALTEIVAHESRQILGEEAWVEQTELLAARIITDQTTYGVDTAVSGAAVTAVNVEGVKLTNVDVLLGLVQDVLVGEAKLEETDVLATTPVHGLYETGYEFGVTGRQVEESVNYNTAFVAVDQYGRIAGVYTDATVAATVEGAHSTEWISGADFDNQAKALGEAIVKNQGVAFNLYETTDYLVEVDEDSVHHYTNQVEGCTVAVEDMLTAINDSLTELSEWEGTLNDGTYVVTGEMSHGGHAVMTVNVIGHNVVSVFLDNTTPVEQASVYRDEEWFPVYKFDREWLSEANEEESQTILVYLDTDEYISVNEYIAVDGKTIDAGDEVTLSETELAGLEIVPGNYTKQILTDRYGMNPENNWYTQANTLAAEFVEVGPYGINLTDGEHTDVTGVTFGHVDEYQQLLIEAILLALEEDTATIPAASGTSTTVLPDGTYFASLEANSKAQQYMAYMVVKGGNIESIVYDVVLADGENVTTKLALGDAYGLAAVSELGEDGLEWYEQAAKYAVAVIENQADIVDEIEDTFTYELGADFGAADFATNVDGAAGVSINTASFETLTQKLVEEALVAKIEMEANLIFDAIEDKDTLFYSEMASFSIGVDSNDFIFGTSNASFELDWESSDNDVLDVDETVGTPVTYDFVVEDVTANTEITITYVLTFDEYEFTKDVTYTVQTAASAELAALNAEEDSFDAFTQIEGFNFDLTTIDPTVATTDGTFLGWADEDYDETAPVYLITTSGLGVGTHTLTALVSYNADGDTVSRDLVVTVVDVDDALEEVAATVKPANILHNGEVTSEETFEFSTTSNIKGITVSWTDPAVANVTTWNGTTNELTILRSYQTEKIIMTATITDGTTDVVKEFEFRAVPATAEIVKDRVEAVLESASLGVKYFDTNTLTNVVTGLDAKLGVFGINEAGLVDIDWSTDNAAVTAGTDLVAVAGTEGTVKVTAKVTVQMNEDTKVEVEKEFEVILFDSVA
ncbi:hypothetical protein KHQ82_06900 [Mycoplasmatota bacterium]|nr:hypothetical protein KHQ82_06900 [Mycoplasmatota bacterium]